MLEQVSRLETQEQNKQNLTACYASSPDICVKFAPLSERASRCITVGLRAMSCTKGANHRPSKDA
jgi:hypothetical protein